MGNLANPASNALKRLAKDESGATLIEFAIILIPLCIVLLGGLDLAYQSYVRSVMQGALDDIARRASVEAPSITCGTGTIEVRVECMIKEKVNNVARQGEYDVKIKNFYQFSGVGRSEKLTTDKLTVGVYDPGDCWEDVNNNGNFDQSTSSGRTGVGGADDIVFYEVNLKMPRITGITSFLSGGPNYDITARSAVRNQPYKTQTTPPTVCK